MTTHLVIPDSHAHPNYSNERAHWLGKLIHDVNPDVIINIGDGADLPSLASYEKGTRAAIGRTYSADIAAHCDFLDKVHWELRKHKKKLPRRVYLIGNHEFRITKAINVQPELEGAISLKDLQLDKYYNEVVDYEGNTPGSITIDGITYAHYFVSGVMGRGISGEHPAYSLITKQLSSATQGHIHTLDFCQRSNAHGRKVNGLVCGVYQDYDAPWAGEVNKLWWKGVVVKHNVEDGNYDPEFISIDRLKKVYGNDSQRGN